MARNLLSLELETSGGSTILRVSRKEVGKAPDPAAFTGRNPPDKRAVWIFDEPRESFFHFFQRYKVVQLVSALTDFTRSNRTVRTARSLVCMLNTS
jgi:hypothetical protein